MKRKLNVLIILLTFSCILSAKISIPSIFSNNTVLQQKSKVAIWGWGDPGETIKVIASWNGKDTIKTKANSYGKWITDIQTIEAGGPYTIEMWGSSYAKISNVMLGEVWLCSGQSNMEWQAQYGLKNKDAEIAAANYPNIRIFHEYRIAATSQLDVATSWTSCTPETMKATSALAYAFAREIQKKMNVPVGIIVAAWGGTPIEVWIEKSKVMTKSELSSALYSKVTDWWPIEPGSTYNAMIAPLVPYGLAGVLWYQGESNCPTHWVYANMMKALVENWRSDFRKELPFYFVQIAPWAYTASEPSRFLREQQELSAKTIPNVGMVVVSDLVDDVTDIHPKNKIDVGIRLAKYALAETYKQEIGAYKSPFYESMQIEKNKIRLSFINVLTGLKYTGKAPSKFLISGSDKNFVEAIAKIEGKTIVVFSNQIKNPVAVRFCFDDTSLPDVFTAEGLPLAPFRTDRW